MYRERNGWCADSARIWLSLEVKGLQYTEVRELSGLPRLQLANGRVHGSNDGFESLIRSLDSAYPDSPPLWPPVGVGEPAVAEMVSAFDLAMPTNAREDRRAGFLFCRDEGFLYDPLPRATFEATLDAANELLARHDDGAFFCGAVFSAADVAWAPQLEKYAAQLPCLYPGLWPRCNDRWPKLARWYEAMDGVAPYACRVKGDAMSWRKVLSTAPWWPSGWPARGGPDERGDPRGGVLEATEDEAAAAYGAAPVSEDLWASYAAGRPHVAPSAALEAAAMLMRNVEAVTRDAIQYRALPADSSASDYDDALRMLVAILMAEDSGAEGRAEGSLYGATGSVSDGDGAVSAMAVSAMASYLDDRICVPRDMGAPPAAAIREVRARFSALASSDGCTSEATATTTTTTTARQVNRF